LVDAQSSQRPVRLYLAVVFWGEEYRRYFLDYCLASLMATGNIPAIANKSQARLLIATTSEDWRAMQSEPIFQAAMALIPIEHVPHEVSGPVPNNEKMAVMSRAHRTLAQQMFEARAHGAFIYPDMIAATNFVGKLDEFARKGIKAVLYMNVRFANEGVLDELQQIGAARRGQPLTIAAPDLVRLTIRHMHSEMARSEFDKSYPDYGSAAFFWTVLPGEDLLFHCGSWIPMLIDYGAIRNHDVSTFDASTVDGDYLAKNFSDVNDVYASRDSDELFMISFTPETRLHYPLDPYPLYRLNWMRSLLKIFMANRYLYGQGILDPIKKELFRLPIRMRGGHSSEQQWRNAEDRAARIVRKIEQRDMSAIDGILNAFLRSLRGIYRGIAYALGWR
jgi:hypothetical protein